MDLHEKELVKQEFENLFNQSKKTDRIGKEILWDNTPDIMSSMLIDNGRKVFKDIMQKKKKELDVTDGEIEAILDDIVHYMKMKYVEYYRFFKS